MCPPMSAQLSAPLLVALLVGRTLVVVADVGTPAGQLLEKSDDLQQAARGGRAAADVHREAAGRRRAVQDALEQVDEIAHEPT